jgi:hypothetical protein
LKKGVIRIATPSLAKHFEFSRDGKRLAVSFADTSILILDANAWRTQIDEMVGREVPADLNALFADLAGDAATSLRAARLLAAAGDRMIPGLAAKAKEHATTLGGPAVRALGWLATPGARETLRKWASGDPKAALTQAAAQALNQ